jgi:N-methylhydantoinase A
LPQKIKPVTLTIAVDTGGTFTDCVWRDPSTGTMKMLKVFSTPKDPSQAISSALQKIANNKPVLLLHGTTVGTNTLLERKGARVAFVTTKGFEDTLEIGRQARPKLYDFFFEAIPPLVPRSLRFGLPERTDKDGRILLAPTESELTRLAGAIRKAKPDAIAISLLFSFANPKNEQLVATALEELDIPLSVSHLILPEFREYERASTIAINAYLQPVMQLYLERLKERMVKANRVFVMQSSGGLAALATASHEPVRTVLSGPAGGVVGAAAAARTSGIEKIISFDMGGTSTDVCLVENCSGGTLRTTNESDIAGLPVRVPMLDIHTVGAGGGSLARFDAGGALRVGPESAGADPGPICYGHGTQPTVTDSNVILGRLRPEQFLGGSFSLDFERTRKITSTWLENQRRNNATIPKMSLEHFAEGVLRVVNANMEKALRVVSIERGHDPRDFTLVAFGGAGALHACELAEGLEIPRVMVPDMPGALSALGILDSDVVKNYSRTLLIQLDTKTTTHRLKSVLDELITNAKREFKQEHWIGKLHFAASADLRYKGQGFELNIPYDKKMLAQFHVEHMRRYGYAHKYRTVEVVTLRLRAWLATKKSVTSQLPMLDRHGRNKPSQNVQAHFGKWHKTNVIDRSAITKKIKLQGPAIITEYSATTVVPIGWTLRCDKSGALLLEKTNHQ